MFYLAKIPGFIKKIYPQRLWQIDTAENELFLTFDDGPHPEHTVFALEELKRYNAKATFFCIGENVKKYPDVYRQILDEGHTTGNHTHNHLNAWKTAEKDYLANVKQAGEYIDSSLFRPPYGKISSFLVKQLASPQYQLQTVMWTVLSGDFDQTIPVQQCLENVLLKAEKGSIIVFHDSDKAAVNMRFALPKVLEFFSQKGWKFSRIEQKRFS